MPTQQDIQRRKTTNNGTQVQNAAIANRDSASGDILAKQASKTSTVGSHGAIMAKKALDNHTRATTAKSVQFVQQKQLGSSATNKAITVSNQAQAAQQALIAAQANVAQLSAQVQSAQAHVNSLMATAPNSPQLASAQAQLAGYAAQLQAAQVALANAQAAANANPTNTQTAAQTNANKLYTLKDILNRIGTNQAISVDELAYVIGNEHNALFAWMINNNPANVNNTMKYTLGIKSLPFAPDKKQMMSQIKLWIKSKNSGALTAVTNAFNFNPSATNWTVNPTLVSYLKTYLHF